MRGAMDKVGEVPDRYLSDEQRLMRQTWLPGIFRTRGSLVTWPTRSS
jgi:hypothetical protein